ncbi:MAG: hypothetical protein WBY44_27440 [Bryobacteraceae bacterium]
MVPNPSNESNSWTTGEAALWCGVNERRLHGWLAQGLLPAIPVGKPHVQKLRDGTRRNKRVYKWIIPREAFVAAWRNFQPLKPSRARTAA